MPSSLFQYEMLPTTWFYLSSLLILAVFFRFNRVFGVRNGDVLLLMAFTPGLVYLAMGATFQGYLWLWIAGILLFARLVLDLFLRRRPLLEPNLSYAGLMFSCVASCAFIIPNLFINRGDACEEQRAWRLEQIVAAASEAEGDFDVRDWPGYRPFLLASRKLDNFFAPSQDAWRRAVSESRDEREASVVEIFGVTIDLDEKALSKRRHAARAVQWAAGVIDGAAFDFEDDPERYGGSTAPLASLNGLKAAPFVPSAPVASTPNAQRPRDVFDAPEPKDAFAPERDTEDARDSDANARAANAEAAARKLSAEEALLVLFVAALQIGIVATIVAIGYYHFGSLQTGAACGLLYLLLPYINQFSARLDHIAPALAILMAVLWYRRPVVAGVALGVAGTLVFYPFFLIPLWFAFYWKKGAVRFALGLSATVLTLAVALFFIMNPTDLGSYGSALGAMFGRHSLFLADADGLWEYLPRFYRIPFISLFGVFCVGFAIWTPRKDLAMLVSCSAALMLASQLWMGRQGGLYMAWYLPLTVLTVFRPNLEDRTAQAVVVDVPAVGEYATRAQQR